MVLLFVCWASSISFSNLTYWSYYNNHLDTHNYASSRWSKLEQNNDIQKYKYRWYMLRHCITLFFVPFYFVRFPDFFLGDQVVYRIQLDLKLTSHTQTIYDLIHVIASIITRSFINFNDIYVKLPEKTVLILRYTSLILPQFIRLVQNLRRYRDTK